MSLKSMIILNPIINLKTKIIKPKIKKITTLTQDTIKINISEVIINDIEIPSLSK